MKALKHVAVLMVFVSCIAFAQDTTTTSSSKITFHGLELSVGAGVANPYLPKEFSDIWKKKLDLNFSIGTMLPQGDLGYGTVSLTVENSRFSFDAAKEAEWKAQNGPRWKGNGADFSMTALSLDFKGTFGDENNVIKPFFLIGIGMHIFKNSSAEYTDSLNNTMGIASGPTFSWRAGAGVEVEVTQMLAVYGEAKYEVAVSNFQLYTFGGGVRYRINDF